MIQKTFTLHSQYGFHLRPAQVMVETMTPFASDIHIQTGNDSEADAKSLLGLMSLGLADRQSVQVEISGSDEAEAMSAMEQLFQTNFGE
ncbi:MULTISPECIES: HPr family phosphocarrier protein [Caproicibacterium]|jgi:phosphotransferase system HPr (HPr) family protein|uniref:HPr family phosphocarrier protein n=1 Tax=Caproicibacterium lactatifermentans TaxID=2666138 RepID=A0A859DNI6_9FIRM|nr:HPr family phosphocarrier protein [Caproicibacterium lactatifermentans]ARP49482.1 hypothetical protein B6259_00385 [Ruminococcaceae bacterium CPB6]MDD4806882.1 HPr family phosphocarrier protein [Oscillospiraceae bacterium]QKN23074.1 HPr family phosphocarrier protein [Caproicibacterium lactatifermentans]QKO30320.1 HPr family phosphocarrier protein [Caproicibacterium lactatifermentans]